MIELKGIFLQRSDLWLVRGPKERRLRVCFLELIVVRGSFRVHIFILIVFYDLLTLLYFILQISRQLKRCF